MEILYLFLIISIILFSNYATLKIGENHYTTHNKNELFDIFYSILPDLHKYSSIFNNIVPILGVISLYFYSNHKLTIEFLSKFVIIMLIRAVTIISTILPKHEKCDQKIDITSLVVGGCYDKIFSGHTAFVLLLTLMYYREHIINMPTLISINTLNILLILGTRSHYTVDVLLSIFVTSTIYNISV